MTRSLVICADDFGLSQAINSAVIELAQLGRVSAVSCMTTMPHWQPGASALGELRNAVGVGLHFNLTEGQDSWPLGRLMVASVTGGLVQTELHDRLNRQLDAFEARFATPPDFVDGHQHVHMLPGVRRILASVIVRRYGKRLPWIRWARPSLQGHDDPVKAMVLRMLSVGFPSALSGAGLRMNLHFTGMYSLRSDAPFPVFLESWIEQAPGGTLIMCHPGRDDPADQLSATRAAEYRYLRSEQFQQALQRSGTVIARQPALG